MVELLPSVRLQHAGRRREGEFDALRGLDGLTVRRLAGAGFLRSSGVAPDVLAEVWNDLFGTELSTCEVVERWARECCVFLDERQRAARLRRERARARAFDCGSWFEYRDLMARLAGHRSYRCYRREMGWSG